MKKEGRQVLKRDIGIVQTGKETSSDTGIYIAYAIAVQHEQRMCLGMQRHTHITLCKPGNNLIPISVPSQCSYICIVNPRRACAARVMVVGSVCPFSHLTSGVSVLPENAVTYSAGNEGQKNRRVFSEPALSALYSISMVSYFYSAENARAHYLTMHRAFLHARIICCSFS